MALGESHNRHIHVKTITKSSIPGRLGAEKPAETRWFFMMISMGMELGRTSQIAQPVTPGFSHGTWLEA